MNDNKLNNLTIEETNDILVQAVELKSYDLINLILHSKEVHNKPTIHKIIHATNPFIAALKNNDITAMIILVQENKGNEFIRHTETMIKCLNYASENSMWEICHFLLDIHPKLDPLIPFKNSLHALVADSNQSPEITSSFYERIKDKGEALMCSCYHGSEMFFNRARKEPEIKFDYDLTFAYIITSQNNELVENFHKL